MSLFVQAWLAEAVAVAQRMEAGAIAALGGVLGRARGEGGRVFVLGVGGSASNAAHCVNDLRVRGRLEAYAPFSDVAELTCRVNDEADGWEEYGARWLETSRCGPKDVVLIFSVSGETEPLVQAAAYAKSREASVCAVLGTAHSTVEAWCDVAVVIPCVNEDHRAGHAEAMQAVVWHAVCAGLAC